MKYINPNIFYFVDIFMQPIKLKYVTYCLESI